jgi:hypothetical protein
MRLRGGSLLKGISKEEFLYSPLNNEGIEIRTGKLMNTKLEKAMMQYALSDSERDAIQAELSRLIELRDKAHEALKGASLNLGQREACRKALPALVNKIKTLNEKLIADRSLRDCDECNIPRHYQDRPR